MFTIKFYSDDGFRQKIEAAESFTILRGPNGDGAEITLHRKSMSDDIRIDIESAENERAAGWPAVYQKAIIENAAGRTTEIITCGRPLMAA